MRRSKKYNCKNRGGVAREVSRRERHIPNTFRLTTSFSVSRSNLPLEHGRLNTKNSGKKEKSLEKSFTRIFEKYPKNCYWPPPPIIFSPAAPWRNPSRTKVGLGIEFTVTRL